MMTKVLFWIYAAGAAGTLVLAAPPAKKPARKAKAVPSKAAEKPAAPPKKSPPVPAKLMGFTPSELDLLPGETYLVELFVPSPTGKKFEGSLTYTPESGVTVTPDKRWTGKLPPWGMKSYPRITAAAETQGQKKVQVALEGGGQAELMVNVAAPNLEVVPGQRQLSVKVTNPLRSRVLTGKVIASNPDRFLEDITTREFRIPPGETGEVVFPLPGAAPAPGETYDFTLAVESYHGYRMRKTYPLRFPEQESK